MSAKEAVDMILITQKPESCLSVDSLCGYQQEGGEVLLNKTDRDRIGADLVNLFKGTALTLSDETVDIEGGCILRRGNILIQCFVREALSNAREELTAEVAEFCSATALTRKEAYFGELISYMRAHMRSQEGKLLCEQLRSMTESKNIDDMQSSARCWLWF